MSPIFLLSSLALLRAPPLRYGFASTEYRTPVVSTRPPLRAERNRDPITDDVVLDLDPGSVAAASLVPSLRLTQRRA